MFFLEYVLQGVAIDECIFMMWNRHSDGVLDVLIDNTNILYEGVGDAALRLRRRLCVQVMCHEMCQSLEQTHHQNLMT